MNGVTEQRGLSARQKARKNVSKFCLSTHSAWMLMALAVMVSSCNTQGQDGGEPKNKSAIAADSVKQPKVNIKVNKHYDDKGNVIGFDSTYTSFYSNVEGDTLKMDSLFRSFDSHFDLGKRSFFGRDLFSRDLDSLFFNDSLRYPDFFHDDFFLKRYELNDSYLRNMMRRMDSLKNDFFREHSQRGRGDESHDL